MNKPRFALAMIACTIAVSLLMMAAKREEPPTEAHIVYVQRGDVHQVAAMTGRLVYADERIVYAQSSGAVSRICVETGQRVAAGQELLRMETETQEDMLSAWFANTQALSENVVTDAAQQAVERSVIRAVEDSVVRQILVEDGMTIAAGTPVMRLTSSRQEISCLTAEADAEKLSVGMWAWISVGGEDCGFAEIISIGEAQTDAESGIVVVPVTLLPQQHLDDPEYTAVDVDVYLAGSDDVQTLPVEAITEQDTVWWVSEGRCTEISAGVVMMDEMLAWVSLPEGMAVAVGSFQEGQRVVEAKE